MYNHWNNQPKRGLRSLQIKRSASQWFSLKANCRRAQSQSVEPLEFFLGFFVVRFALYTEFSMAIAKDMVWSYLNSPGFMVKGLDATCGRKSPHVIGSQWDWLLLAKGISEPGTGTKSTNGTWNYSHPPPSPLKVLTLMFLNKDYFFFNKFPSPILFLSLSSLLFASRQVV